MVKHQHKIQKATVGDHDYSKIFKSPKKSQPPKDSTLRTKLYYIRKLVKAKDYNQARYELLGIDHPKTEQWLERINQRDPDYREEIVINSKYVLGVIASALLVAFFLLMLSEWTHLM
jgi:hypothetical protein